MFALLMKLVRGEGRALVAASFGNNWSSTADPGLCLSDLKWLVMLIEKYLSLNGFSWNWEVSQR